ncbi:hypothetical protein B0H11DRAFT_1992257 [Mycena galericulata]|nr:hypothetical protein B0H11DRAFT_1992257 [Mycena galericulata]
MLAWIVGVLLQSCRTFWVNEIIPAHESTVGNTSSTRDGDGSIRPRSTINIAESRRKSIGAQDGFARGSRSSTRERYPLIPLLADAPTPPRSPYAIGARLWTPTRITRASRTTVLGLHTRNCLKTIAEYRRLTRRNVPGDARESGICTSVYGRRGAMSLPRMKTTKGKD